jgi:hypothetical protein
MPALACVLRYRPAGSVQVKEISEMIDDCNNGPLGRFNSTEKGHTCSNSNSANADQWPGIPLLREFIGLNGRG